MNNDYQGTMLQDFYEIVRNLQPELKEFERTEDIAERVARVIEKSGFLVKYDSHIAPLIDAAVMRNPYDEDELPMFRRVLDDHRIIFSHRLHRFLGNNIAVGTK